MNAVNFNFIKHGFITIGLLALPLLPSQVFAHGYVMEPASRGYACKVKKNSQCDAIVYEPQSVEGGNNFPQAGPADGQIANAGIALFKTLNEQSPTRWEKTKLSTGINDFTWYHTARHATKTWRYFITKQGWNQSAALTRNSFDLKPFCTIEGNYKQPTTQVTHSCPVPANRSGYHVILAVWDIADTSNSFYNAIDVQIDANNSTPPEPKPPVVKPTPTTPTPTPPVVKPTPPVVKPTPTWPTWSTPPVVKPTPTPSIPTPPVTQPTTPATSSAYQFVYPENIKEYKAGTRVLASDGQVYQCKPFPYSGWCTIQAPQYAPGTGSDWSDAWILKK